MNRQTDTTAQLSSARLHHADTLIAANLNTDALAGLSVSDLVGLDDALSTISGVCAGLTCQPKFWVNDSRARTLGGDYLNRLNEIVDQISEEVVIELRHRMPSGLTPQDVEDRGTWLLRAEIIAGSDLAELAHFASGEAANFRQARSSAR